MKQGYIYKIRHIIEPEDVVLPYIGSTWTSLSNRFSMHKWLYKKWLENGGKECATYKLFTDYGIDSFEIIELERYEVEDKQQLRKWEQYWMDQIQCCNKVRAVMKPKPVHDAEYYQKNAERIKANVNEYRIKNKEVISQRKKDYRERNKEKLAEKGKVKVHCDVCNIDIRKQHIRRHERSKTHIDNLNKSNN